MNTTDSGPNLTDMLAKGVLRVVSPGGPKGLSILIYHRVLPERDALFTDEVDRNDFDLQMGYLKSMFNVLPLSEAVERARSNSLPPRAACITFDDGYADNAEVALPVLQKHQLPCSFFIATAFLNGGRMWNDTLIELVRRNPGDTLDAEVIGLGTHSTASLQARRATISALIASLKYLPLAERLEHVDRLAEAAGVALPDNLMMTTSQVVQLHRAGMEIGGHTVNHPILAKIPAQVARQEIADGKHALEEMIGEKIRIFAYPNGKPGEDYLREHVEIVKSLGFQGAVSTSWGASKGGFDEFQLPRFTPWDRQRLKFAARMARNLTVPASHV